MTGLEKFLNVQILRERNDCSENGDVYETMWFWMLSWANWEKSEFLESSSDKDSNLSPRRVQG